MFLLTVTCLLFDDVSSVPMKQYLIYSPVNSQRATPNLFMNSLLYSYLTFLTIEQEYRLHLVSWTNSVSSIVQ